MIKLYTSSTDAPRTHVMASGPAERAECHLGSRIMTYECQEFFITSHTKLIFFCGKMAAGKSTLARELAQREHAVLLVQDEFLESLYPGEITDIAGFVKCSSRLKNALAPHICALLSKGISVVLDFPANTKAQRAWFRELFERANVNHELHFIDASDAVAKSQLKNRRRNCSST